MKTTLDYLNQVIKRQVSIENDNQLASYLGITRQAIHQYKHGQNMSVLVAIKVALELEISPLETVSATLHAQAKTDIERKFWKEQYDRATAIDQI